MKPLKSNNTEKIWVDRSTRDEIKMMAATQGKTIKEFVSILAKKERQGLFGSFEFKKEKDDSWFKL